MKVSDYIVDFLVKKGVTDCFMVVGGGAMHLNNSFGHTEGMKCTHFHHEQGAAIAAESYSRYENRVAALCVTSGPGGTNAITGVLGGWLDSLPMFVVSGQVRYDTTVRFMEKNCPGTGTDSFGMENPVRLPRAIGDQEYDITKMTENICKYAVMLEDPSDIRYHLEKAWHLMTTGRPGPVWIDVPVNFQAAQVEPESLRGYDCSEYDDKRCTVVNADGSRYEGGETALLHAAKDVLADIAKAKRPVIYAGGGVRIS